MVTIPKKPPPSTTNDASKSEANWGGPKDARTLEGAGTYPNADIYKTRSGHNLIFDDSNGAESITMQHRTGSMVQFMPDGAVQIVVHNGQYNLVFGEKRVLITGAHDVTVQGTASLRVEGDYNMSIKGNMNMTVDQDFNVTAKNFNQTIAENVDMVASNLTGKISGNGLLSTHGNFMIAGHGDVALASTGGSLALGASKDVGVRSTGAGIHLQSSDDTNIKSESKLNMQATGKASLKSAGTVAIEGPSAIHLNTNGQASDAEEAANKVTTKAAPKTPTVSENFSSAPVSASYKI